MELVRLFAHEAVHVLLRRAVADMNESSPEIIKLKSQNQPPKAEESGILIELELFGAKIKFNDTCKLTSFDGTYFSKLLDDVINGNVHNLDESKVIIVKPSDYPNLALDMDLPKEVFLDI